MFEFVQNLIFINSSLTVRKCECREFYNLHTFRLPFSQLLSYPHFPIKGAGCAGSIPSMHWAEARETPWTGEQSITAVQILFTASNLRWNPSCDSLRFRDCVLLYSPLKMKLCKQLMPLFLLCQDIQHSVVHLVALHGQRHCHGTNWPHWSDTECFVSFVSQVPTCASQNKLSCNVAGQKNAGACWGPALPPERKQMFHSRNVLWFWTPSQHRHQQHGGELKAWSVIVCGISRGRSRWDHRRKTRSFSALL